MFISVLNDSTVVSDTPPSGGKGYTFLWHIYLKVLLQHSQKMGKGIKEKTKKKEYGYYWSPAHPPKQTVLQIVKWAWVQLVLDHIK